MADLFDGIETVVPGNSGGVPLTQGEYLLKIEDVIYLKTQLQGDAFIVEYSVLETSDPAKHPIGVKRSWYQSMKNLPVAMGEIVKFMYAGLGYDQKRDADRIAKEVTPNIKAWTNKACKEKVMNGVELRASVMRKPPNEKAKLKAAAAGKPEPVGYDNPKFSPKSPNPPPVRT